MIWSIWSAVVAGLICRRPLSSLTHTPHVLSFVHLYQQIGGDGMHWILISYPAFKPSYEPSVNRRQISGEEKANECRNCSTCAESWSTSMFSPVWTFFSSFRSQLSCSAACYWAGIDNNGTSSCCFLKLTCKIQELITVFVSLWPKYSYEVGVGKGSCLPHSVCSAY